MKKGVLLFVALWLCTNAAAQYSEWELSHYKRDSLTRVYLAVHSQRPDTLSAALWRVYFEKQVAESPGLGGGTTLWFETPNYTLARALREYYVIPLVVMRPLRPGVRFEADWASILPRGISVYECSFNRNDPYYEPQEILQVRDTLITIISPSDAGGTTPEGHVYRFCGKHVKKVRARTRAVFDVALIIHRFPAECWGIGLSDLKTSWQEYPVNAVSYRMPVIRRVDVDLLRFQQTRDEAVRTLQECLFDKRYSFLDVETFGSREFREQGLWKIQSQLLPGWRQARSFSELPLDVSFRYFETEALVEMQDGHTERFVHVATYETNIP